MRKAIFDTVCIIIVGVVVVFWTTTVSKGIVLYGKEINVIGKAVKVLLARELLRYDEEACVCKVRTGDEDTQDGSVCPREHERIRNAIQDLVR